MEFKKTGVRITNTFKRNFVTFEENSNVLKELILKILEERNQHLKETKHQRLALINKESFAEFNPDNYKTANKTVDQGQTDLFLLSQTMQQSEIFQTRQKQDQIIDTYLTKDDQTN